MERVIVHGKQKGNPVALGEVLVQLGTMENPPKQFMAGADAIAAVKPVLEGRLAEIVSYKVLSEEATGSFG